ncbi:MAG: hypothetical protein AABY14_04310 [Nanoarchaeota archaeon]
MQQNVRIGVESIIVAMLRLQGILLKYKSQEVKNMAKKQPCCKGGICPSCDCCICICIEDLKKSLTPEARKLLIKALS